MTEIVAVLTTESVRSVLASGMTQAWPLDHRRAADCEFVVLCHNARKSRHIAGPHGSAFLVGRIKDVVPSTLLHGRWSIVLAEYAEVVWAQQSFARKPIRYGSAEDYRSADGRCAFDALDLKPVPIAESMVAQPPGAEFQLTIAGAKAWLAASLFLPESAIEITIKA